MNKWERMCSEWEAEGFQRTKKKKNPYETDGVSKSTTYPTLQSSLLTYSLAISEAQVRKELAEEEHNRIEEGGVSVHVTSASTFVVHGLELEEAQYVTMSISFI